MIKKFTDMDAARGGAHRDYEVNLRNARLFCEKKQKTLLRGMAVLITNSYHLQDALLMISFCPGPEEKCGNFARPVFLHQERSAVEQETQQIFQGIFTLAKAFWDKKPKLVQGKLIN